MHPAVRVLDRITERTNAECPSPLRCAAQKRLKQVLLFVNKMAQEKNKKLKKQKQQMFSQRSNLGLSSYKKPTDLSGQYNGKRISYTFGSTHSIV